MKLFFLTLFYTTFTLFSAPTCHAQIFIQDMVVTDKIVSLNQNGIITLANKTTYTSSKRHIDMSNLHIGDLVSISYTIENGSNIFFEITPGKIPTSEQQKVRSKQKMPHLK